MRCVFIFLIVSLRIRLHILQSLEESEVCKGIPTTDLRVLLSVTKYSGRPKQDM